MKINNLEQIASNYEGYFVDLWGVLHNGKQGFPAAIAALKQLKSLNKKIILLSNSPRRTKELPIDLEQLGILPEFYDEIYTSGEDCFQNLQTSKDSWYNNLGNNFFHIGPEKNMGMVNELNRARVEDLEAANFVLVTGTLGWETDINAYIPWLEKALARELPLICANPDLKVLFEGQLMVCAGAIANHYKQMGGEVRYHGKPYPEIYNVVMQKIQPIKRERILAIGDSLRTDIKGAADQGIDTLLVLSGIHNYLKQESYQSICDYGLEHFKIRPKYVAQELEF